MNTNQRLKRKFEWTAIFLIRGVKENIAHLKMILDQLLAVNKSEDLSIILCIHVKAELLDERFPRPESDQTGWTTLFYKLVSASDGGCILELIEQSWEFDIRDPEQITNFFRQEILAYATSEHYMLFTWDHGQPFGIFPADGNKQIMNKENPLVIHFRLWEHYQREKRMNLVDQDIELKNTGILTITELRDAITWAFNGQKIDLLVMSNCYLQFFDTGYELSSCVDYLIAFETRMYFADLFDYKGVLETVSYAPNTPPNKVAQILVNSFAVEKDPGRMQLKKEVALFANDLSWYPVLAKLIDELSLNLVQQLPRHLETIKSAIDRCNYFSPEIPEFSLIDFGNFINNLYNEMPMLFKGDLFAQLSDQLTKVVVASFVGDNYVEEINDSYFAPSGFSIHLPTPGVYHNSFPATYMQRTSTTATQFTKLFKWQGFVYEYIRWQELKK